MYKVEVFSTSKAHTYSKVPANVENEFGPFQPFKKSVDLDQPILGLNESECIKAKAEVNRNGFGIVVAKLKITVTIGAPKPKTGQPIRRFQRGPKRS
jgi:hypothetical protein